MALLSDDSDLQVAYFRIITGGNGDYYPQIITEDEYGIKTIVGTRISTSGGNAPTDVKVAIADLWRAMEKYGLND